MNHNCAANRTAAQDVHDCRPACARLAQTVRESRLPSLTGHATVPIARRRHCPSVLTNTTSHAKHCRSVR